MKKLKEIFNKNKILVIVMAVSIVLISGVSFAYFAGLIGAPAITDLDVTSQKGNTIVFTPGTAINLYATEDNFGQTHTSLSGQTISTAEYTSSKTELNPEKYNVYFVINVNDFEYTTASEETEILLKVTNPEGVEVTSITGFTHDTVTDNVSGDTLSGFDVTTFMGIVPIAIDYEIDSINKIKTTQQWKVELTFVNLATKQNDNTKKTFEGKLILQQGPYEPTLAESIIFDNYDNDDFIYHSDKNEDSAGDNSFRFSGANPDNYVTFNDESWRIIGIFDDKLKLIRETPLDTLMAFDTGNSNDFATSDINTYLNTTFYNALNSDAKNLTVSSKLNIGPISTNTGGEYHKTPGVIARKESFLKTSSSYKVGLMNASDYLFAASETYHTLNNYDATDTNNDYADNANMIATNWMYIFDTYTASDFEWTVTPATDGNSLMQIRAVGNTNSNYATNNGLAARPTVYITGDARLSIGTGTSADSYILSLPLQGASKHLVENHDAGEGLYQHTADLANGAGDNNYRYSGPDSLVKNYVTFNDEMWRIIGIFDGKLKLIKETSIGTYEFDPGNDNSWADDGGGVEGNQLLNNYYFNSTVAPNLLADCGGSGRGSCDFTSTGLDATARAMAETSTWYLGAPDTNNQTANAFYKEERGSATTDGTHITTEANIGLLYMSDYGYAASSNAWTTNLVRYDTNSIPANNWMFSGLYEWSISPNLSGSSSVLGVSSSGDANNYYARGGSAWRPTLYLKSNVEIIGGSGTESDPFKIGLDANKYLIDSHGAEEGLYQHTADLTNGAGDNNYRYSGPDSLVKNYVTFNDEMWRIIGVFDGNVKLIKETSIGTYEFDPGDDNSWADDGGGAEGNQLLNNYYFNSAVAPNLLADCGNTSRGSCDFTSTGLDATARLMVETSTWYLGAPDTYNQTANAFYNDERGSVTSTGTHITTEANIGLMYVSDYGYAASSNAWTTNLIDYNTNSILASNWMCSGVFEWSISPYLSRSNFVWYVYDNGDADSYYASYGSAWRPTLYLKAETKIVGGTGTESDPFQLGL